MLFTPENIYHVYNRGNNRQLIFFEERNYVYFLDKLKKHVSKYSDIICYCLMPNHFHFLIQVKSIVNDKELNNEIAVMLRSYTRAINIQENRTGSLFQQKTKAKNVRSYANVYFNYIHQNPLRAGIADKIEDWKHSSFGEYLETKESNISNTGFGRRLFGFNTKDDFYSLSYEHIENDLIEKIL